jgi:hypothetical protein
MYGERAQRPGRGNGEPRDRQLEWPYPAEEWRPMNAL